MKIESYFKYGFTLGSPVLCLILLFFACGRPPAQAVKIFINTPKVPYSKFSHTVDVAMRFDGFNGTFFKQKLYPGENDVLLPKGNLKIFTGFFSTVENDQNSIDFAYSHFNQDVTVDKLTQTLEVYYPQFSDVQYRHFGLILKQKIKNGFRTLSNAFISLQDPIAGNLMINPKTGENLGFTTDSNGRASVDVPVLGNPKSIQLFIKANEDDRGQIVWIPLETNHQGMEFYEIVLSANSTVTPLDEAKNYYLDESKTIQKILNEGKNPRFTNVISIENYQTALENEFKINQEIDLLKPIAERDSNQILPDNLYNLSGRKIEVLCKPHNGSLYETCSRFITVQKIKKLLNLEENSKVDFLLTDQDGFSVFTDEKSTQENTMVVTITIE